MIGKENDIMAEFEKLGIKIEYYTLKDESWISILNTLKRLYEKYPEVSKGVLGKIRAIETKYKFLYSIGYDFDSQSQTYASAPGMILELSKIRFDNPKYIKDEMIKKNLFIDADDIIPYMIAHAFSHVLFINMGLLSGQLNPEKIRKKDYEEYTSAEEYLNKIKEKAREKMLAEDEEDIGDAPAMRQFTDAVANDLIGKEREVTRHIWREYRSLLDEIRKNNT